MKIAQPKVQQMTYSFADPVSILKHIEACGRTCYKSEDKLTDTSYEQFVKNILARNHGAVLEHATYAFEADEMAFERISNVIETMENIDGQCSYLHRTTTKDRFIVSGNVRAWREFITYMLSTGWLLDPVAELLCISDEAKLLLFCTLLNDKGPFNTFFTSKNPYCLRLIDWDSAEAKSTYTLDEYLVHCPLTFRFVADRGVTHEIVRHRPASYAQESTRYCSYNKDKFGNQVTYIDLVGGINLDPKVSALEESQIIDIYKEWLAACQDAENHYQRMIAFGATPQLARSVLNHSTKTELVMTATLGEWQHFCELRCASAAHPQMREVACEIQKAVDQYMFEIFPG